MVLARISTHRCHSLILELVVLLVTAECAWLFIEINSFTIMYKMQNAFVVVPFFLWVLLNLFEIWVLPIQLFNLIYILWYCLIIVWLLASCLSMVRGPTEY